MEDNSRLTPVPPPLRRYLNHGPLAQERQRRTIHQGRRRRKKEEEEANNYPTIYYLRLKTSCPVGTTWESSSHTSCPASLPRNPSEYSWCEEDELRGAAVLVLANKQDLPRAMPVSDITEALALSGLSNTWSVQGCCAVSGTGLVEGLDWLSTQVQKL
ncbi:hypothetical protein NHX12_029685 [Muraenolepis orangiensis]|uniref:Uncharacterized protein n=1 Tax=Muraenolepis orangiensis TaxID=630683 RepID=A0A9Q0E6P7_9TELE|nr:hypothetical protein NHX12_029685 [Muraenolepis orangiensis]